MKSLAAAFGMEEKSGSAGSASAFGAHTSASTSISAKRNVMVPRMMSMPIGNYSQPFLRKFRYSSVHTKTMTSSTTGYAAGSASSGMCSKFMP